MIGNAPQDRDDLLVAGIRPAAEPFLETQAETEPETRPVFVDATGWRARVGRRLGLAAGAVLIVFLGALGIGMTTGTDMPMTPWSEPTGHLRVKVNRPNTPTGKTGERPAAARPGPTGRVGSPAPSAEPRSSSSPAPSSVTPTSVSSTSRPGNSHASPPAWGHNKKSP